MQLAQLSGPEDIRKLVALKLIHDQYAADGEFLSMFTTEARISIQLQHPNVVTIFEAGQIERRQYLAMEYVHGESLLDLLRASSYKGESLDWSLCARIVADAAKGLHAAHELRDSEGQLLGVVHRDISPQNILISYDGHVKIADFGIAYAAQRASTTKTGVVKGKISYMSPEQIQGKRLDRRSDIFSLGVLAHELLCQRRLFRRDNDVSTALAITTGEIPAPSQLRSEIPPMLEDTILKALSLDRDERHATAAELAYELETILVREKKLVTERNMAAVMNGLFSESRQHKEEQIRLARSQLGSGAQGEPAPPRIGSERPEDGSPDATPDAAPTRDGSIEPAGSNARRRIRTGLVAGALGLTVGALLVLLSLGRSDRAQSSVESLLLRAESELHGSSVDRASSAERMSRDGARGDRSPSTLMVTLRVSVRLSAKAPPPSSGKAGTAKSKAAQWVPTVVFRGKPYRGAELVQQIPRSEIPERIDLSAPNHLPESLDFTPTSDQTFVVTLKPGPGSARSNDARASDGAGTTRRPPARPGRRQPGGESILRDLE